VLRTSFRPLSLSNMTARSRRVSPSHQERQKSRAPYPNVTARRVSSPPVGMRVPVRDTDRASLARVYSPFLFLELNIPARPESMCTAARVATVFDADTGPTRSKNNTTASNGPWGPVLRNRRRNSVLSSPVLSSSTQRRRRTTSTAIYALCTFPPPGRSAASISREPRNAEHRTSTRSGMEDARGEKRKKDWTLHCATPAH